MKREWTELEFADWTLLASGVGQNWAFEMKRYRERMSGACLLLRRKEFFNLAELLENAQLPRAIERFINQKAAIVGGPYII